MGKQSSKALKPHEIEALARQQNRMNNPNQSNIFGTTTTTFGDDDQADIVQTLSAPMERIINSQMDFVGQGPAQLGNFTNPFIQGMLQGNSDGIARRGGYAPSNASMMGGFEGFNPQFSPQQQETAQMLGVNAAAPMDLPGVNNLPQPTAENAPAEQEKANIAQQIGSVLSAYGGGQAANPFNQLGRQIGGLAAGRTRKQRGEM